MSVATGLDSQTKRSRIGSRKCPGFYTEDSSEGNMSSGSDDETRPAAIKGEPETDMMSERYGGDPDLHVLQKPGQGLKQETHSHIVGGSQHQTLSDNFNSELISGMSDDIDNVMSEDDIDAKMNRLVLENEKMQKEAQKLEKMKKLIDLRNQNAALKVDLVRKVAVTKVANNNNPVNVTASDRHAAQSAAAATQPSTLHDLRNVRALRDRACAEVDFCLGRRSRTPSPAYSDISEIDSVRGKPQKKKSGISVRASEDVKNPQVWPHTLLDFEFISNPIDFMELDLALFVAGELEVLSGDDLSEKEKDCRRELLKSVVYFSRVYEWKSVLKMVASILRKIECGKANWGSDFSRIERHTLVSKKNVSLSVSKSKSEGKSNDTRKTWFCKDYQNGNCELKDPHKKYIGSREFLVHHVCAVCLQKDKVKLAHPETSAACPYNSGSKGD